MVVEGCESHRGTVCTLRHLCRHVQPSSVQQLVEGLRCLLRCMSWNLALFGWQSDPTAGACRRCTTCGPVG
jgi:hypothetical protein